MAVLKYKIDAKNDGTDRTVVSCRDFSFIIDEPVIAGGENSGPTPVEYLIGSLAGCMGVVCNKVAREMNLEVSSIRFEVEGDIDTDRFMGKPGSEEKRSGYTEIRVKIDADVNADAQTKYRWLKAVKERCPVSDNISNMTPVRVKLV